jgi:hypothetical protein
MIHMKIQKIMMVLAACASMKAVHGAAREWESGKTEQTGGAAAGASVLDYASNKNYLESCGSIRPLHAPVTRRSAAAGAADDDFDWAHWDAEINGDHYHTGATIKTTEPRSIAGADKYFIDDDISQTSSSPCGFVGENPDEVAGFYNPQMALIKPFKGRFLIDESAQPTSTMDFTNDFCIYYIELLEHFGYSGKLAGMPEAAMAELLKQSEDNPHIVRFLMFRLEFEAREDGTKAAAQDCREQQQKLLFAAVANGAFVSAHILVKEFGLDLTTADLQGNTVLHHALIELSETCRDIYRAPAEGYDDAMLTQRFGHLGCVDFLPQP